MTYAGVAAGGSTAAMTTITNMTLSSAAATIDITSIPTGYRTLFGVLAAITTSGSNNQMDTLLMRFNNVSTAGSYTWMGNRAPSAVNNYPTLMTSGTSATSIKVGDLSPYQTQYATQVKFWITDYANTTHYAQVHSESSYNDGSTSSNYWLFNYAGQFQSAATVNRLTLTTVGNFAANTDFALYGLA